jgi:uracil-DNA glycosylase
MKFNVDINPNVAGFCPKKDQIFRALQLTPLPIVKVIILGSDPYHGPNQANGLAFSVNKDVDLPPSLKNIFKELKNDVGIDNTNGDLETWALQGVLLLNTVLTTEIGRPGAHFNKGWETYTDTVIKQVNDERDKVIFVLWGNKAQEKKRLIDTNKHYILEASHPSPLGAHHSFMGCKHFSQINDILKSNGLSEIDWKT